MYACTYINRRSRVSSRCIMGMCAGNTDVAIDPDIECLPHTRARVRPATRVKRL